MGTTCTFRFERMKLLSFSLFVAFCGETVLGTNKIWQNLIGMRGPRPRPRPIKETGIPKTQPGECKIHAQWSQIEQKIEGKLSKSGGTDYHLTLQQIIIKLKEIMASMMTEKEQFDEIEKLYASGNIPGLIAEQNIKANKLATQRTELQQRLIGLKKSFIEQTGFCKVSFKEYNEEVCDIRSHAQNLN